LILQHSLAPEDYLLAHELCVVALSQWKTNVGALDARGLAAASEDRFLMSINQFEFNAYTTRRSFISA
jgi:hypothetical protein